MSPVSKALISLGALSMVTAPVVASASSSVLPAQASRPVGAHLNLDNDGELPFLPILGVITVVVIIGVAVSGHKKSK